MCTKRDMKLLFDAKILANLNTVCCNVTFEKGNIFSYAEPRRLKYTGLYSQDVP